MLPCTGVVLGRMGVGWCMWVCANVYGLGPGVSAGVGVGDGCWCRMWCGVERGWGGWLGVVDG